VISIVQLSQSLFDLLTKFFSVKLYGINKRNTQQQTHVLCQHYGVTSIYDHQLYTYIQHHDQSYEMAHAHLIITIVIVIISIITYYYSDWFVG